MASLNQCTFIGNAGKDPELTVTPAGMPVTRFTLAVNETHKNARGEKVEETLWLTVVCWNKQAELAERLIIKGTQLYIQGKLVIRKYKDRLDQQQTAVEIIVNDFKLLGGGKPKEALTGARSSASQGDPFLPDYPDDLN